MGQQESLTENKHHNIPRSRGGSRRKINVSRILTERHDRFHTWSWNRTPEMLIRKILIHAIGFKDSQALPPSALEDMLMEMRVDDWTDLYDPDAVVWVYGKGNSEHIAKANDYAVEHWSEELGDTRHTINALLHGRHFPVSQEDGNDEFLQRALRFFQTDSPRDATQRLLTEKYKNTLLWVQPLKEAVRQKLLTVLASATPVFVGSKEKDPLVDILREHEMYILSSILHERSR